MANKKALYEDMTGFGLILFRLAQATNAALKNNLTETELLECERDVRNIAGIGSTHPAHHSPLIPFVEAIFPQIKARVSQGNQEPQLLHFANVINGTEAEEYGFDYPPSDIANLKEAPAWFTQVIEVGEKGLDHPGDFSGEKLGALSRNIPGDTTLGMLCHSFLRALSTNPPDLEKARSLWPYLKGEKPLRCKVKVRGLFVELTTSELTTS